MSRNPYQKQSSIVGKRQIRPWECQSPSIYPTMLQPRRTPAPPPTRVVAAGSDLQPSLGCHGPKNKCSEMADDPFDCGINWDDAIQVMDGTHLTQEPASTKTTAFVPRQSVPLFVPTDTVMPACNHFQSTIVVASLSPVTKLAPTGLALPTENWPLPLVTNQPSQPRVVNRSVSSPWNLLKPPLAAKSSAKTNTPNEISSLRPDTWKQQTIQTGGINDAMHTIQQQDPQTQASLPPELRFDLNRLEPVQDSYRQLLVKEAQVSKPLLNGWTLFSHQKKAILRGLLMRRIILALDMGLGKTCIGCVWAKAFVRTMTPIRAIVICPVSLKQEWKRTAEEATGLSVCDGEEQLYHKEAEITHQTMDMWITSWAKVPTRLNDPHCRYVVVADEAHCMQSMQAARTRDVLSLVQSPNCMGVLLLTGTPMKNGKPSNLFPLLKAVGHPLGVHQRAYESHFCAGRDMVFGGGRPSGRRVWNATGSSNLAQLRELTHSHILYLTKEECLKDLPPQTRVVHQVPVSSRRQMEHNQAQRELAKIYSQRDQMANGNDAVLGAVQRLRLVGAFAKIEATVALATSILQDENAIVIFTSFVAVAKSISQQLATAGFLCELLTGETPAKKRQEMVDNFQKGHSAVFVSTFGAGGVGLTLTASYSVILLDRPWTPGEAVQAEDRVRRIGQTKPVTSYWMSAFEIDRQIDIILQQKKQVADSVLDHSTSRDDEPAGVDAPKLSILQLLNSILPVDHTGTPSKTHMKQTSLLQFASPLKDV